ncbi:hypothetical protein ABPG75_009290 [Micractinium tetrahymenae]
MQSGCVLVTATCPDPKLAKAALAPFHASRDGRTTISTSGFVLLHGGQPVVLTSAAAVLPLLQQSRRHALQAGGSGLAGASSADLVAGAQLHALPSDAAEISVCGGSAAQQQQPVELRLAGLAELPGVRQALARLLAAPSIAGPGGWQLGWLLHHSEKAQLAQQGKQPARPPWPQATGGSSGVVTASSASSAAARPSPASLMLEAACHVAVLLPASPDGAAALAQHALAWPACGAAMQAGQPLAAVGAPFGALAPQHFTGFTACGIVSAAVTDCDSGSSSGSDSRASGGGSGNDTSCTPAGPALLLSDLRCGPGMEGSPVFAAAPTVAAAGAAAAPPVVAAAGAAGTTIAEQAQSIAEQAGVWAAAAAKPVVPSRAARSALAGMLLPPLKLPAAQVEFALIAPAPALAAAVLAVLQRCSRPAALQPAQLQQPGQQVLQGASSLAAAAAKAAALGASAQLSTVLQGIVAVLAGGGWASGVIVSPAGHILTNAHLLEPAMHTALPGSGRQPPSGVQGLLPRAGAAAAGSTAPALPHPPARVLLPDGSGARTISSSSSWATADVLYVFSGPLDLAVLQLRPRPAGEQAQRPTAWRALALSSRPPRPGQRVCVAGFPAFNPRSELLGAVVTADVLAKVVRLPGSGTPAMLLTTAAVHSGASGGAVLDAVTGELLGLVTSNAKHSSRRSSASDSLGGLPQGRHTILPHINFSIPAAQLQPVLAAGGMRDAAAARAAWQALDAQTAGDTQLQQVWRLDRQRRRPSQQQEAGQQQAGGAFGGARPPAKMKQLLEELQRQQRQGQQQPDKAGGQQQQARAKL